MFREKRMRTVAYLRDRDLGRYYRLETGVWSTVAAVAVTVAVLALIVWGAWWAFMHNPAPLAEGHVENRRYTSQYTHYHDGGTTCWARNDDGACTFSTDNPDVPHEHCVGGCYELLVNGCSTDPGERVHCRDEWIAVGPLEYDECTAGRYWLEGQGCPPR